MNRYLTLAAGLALAGAAVLTSSHAGASTVAGPAGAGGGWGTAREVPGTAALNTGGTAAVGPVSCASAGNCSAGGTYVGPGNGAFVVSQVNGTWQKAEKVPGTLVQGLSDIASIASVSCASAGNCSAGGTYFTGNTGSEQEAFVVSQVHGTWGKAEEVPGTAALNVFGGIAEINSVSCASAGNCSAGGDYTDRSGNGQAFAVSEVNGTWGKAEKVPGIAALNGGAAAIESVSCASAGNCSAVGFNNLLSHVQLFAVSQVNGTWQKAEKIPGIAALNTGGDADVSSVSCGSAGNCSTGGVYTDGSGHQQAFVVSQVNGTWQKAEKVPGTAGGAVIESVSCASAGNCSAGGAYSNAGSDHIQAFVVSQVHGTWQKAEEVPGTAALNTGGTAIVSSVSCASAGNCAAGGTYTGRRRHLQAFVVSQVNGTWLKAEEIPGTAALNTGGRADVGSVSCGSPGHCAAGGSYTDGQGHRQAFVDSRT